MVKIFKLKNNIIICVYLRKSVSYLIGNGIKRVIL